MAQINKPSDYFNTITWTGDDTSPRSITGVGFQPDLVWGKNRSQANGHNLYDVIRGVGTSADLASNSTNAEGGNPTASFGYLSSLDSDGFTATTGSTDASYFNQNNENYVAWNWLAGGTASSNTDGTITSSVSANTTSGFSVCSFTEAASAPYSFGHGLGVEPNVVIFKTRGATGNWQVYHSALSSPNSSLLQLNSNAAVNTGSTWWGTINSSIVTINSGLLTPSTTSIAYCFAQKKGYSKFGSFNGNGSADGTFVYTGFKPAFIITKLSSATGNWLLHDNKRNGYNGGNNYLYPDASDAELTLQLLDITSNGFKMRFAGGTNSSGTSIYMAFAESPLVGTNNIPATAR